MHPQPTAVELLARQHRTDRLAAARPRPVRETAPRAAARPAVASWFSRLGGALRPAGTTAGTTDRTTARTTVAPCCA